MTSSICGFSVTSVRCVFIASLFIYADIIVNGFTAIPPLHNWERMYLPIICLLVKILFGIYYLSGTNFLGTYFRDWQLQKIAKFRGINFRDFTIGSEFRGIYFRRSIGFFLLQNSRNLISRFRGQTAKIFRENCPQKICALKVLHEIICLDVENFLIGMCFGDIICWRFHFQHLPECYRSYISVKFHFTDLAPCRPSRAAGPSTWDTGGIHS